MASRQDKAHPEAPVYRLNRGLRYFYVTASAAVYQEGQRGYFLYMKDDQRDSNSANPKDDPLQRIAVLERRVAVLTRENERLETFLAVLRHRIFGRWN